MKVTLVQLSAFATLCDTLHFTRAAERLGLSQPTVSKEMRTLERVLGLQLLARSAGGTRLTPAGQALESHARSVLEQIDGLMAAAALERRRTQRQVTIAASPSIVNHLLPETLRRIDDVQLGIRASALEVETGGVIEAVEHRSAPVIGVQWHPEDPEADHRALDALLLRQREEVRRIIYHPASVAHEEERGDGDDQYYQRELEYALEYLA